MERNKFKGNFTTTSGSKSYGPGVSFLSPTHTLPCMYDFNEFSKRKQCLSSCINFCLLKKTHTHTLGGSKMVLLLCGQCAANNCHIYGK